MCYANSAKKRIFGFANSNRKIKPNDGICFYLGGVGFIGCAMVKSSPRFDPTLISENFPWVFDVDDVELFFDEPSDIPVLFSE